MLDLEPLNLEPGKRIIFGVPQKNTEEMTAISADSIVEKRATSHLAIFLLRYFHIRLLLVNYALHMYNNFDAP